MTHPLDRPVWNALADRWAPLAHGDVRARRVDPTIGPFAALADPTAGAALAALIEPGAPVWLVETAAVAPPAGTRLVRSVDLLQMVADAVPPPQAPFAIEDLGPTDAEAMYALATATEPGPWLARTHELGGFVGVRDAGRLVAMAGERMKPVGFAEVSGVCTYPEHRGRGYAAQLMRAVASRMLARGDRPFLHVYPTNVGAIGLYENLGFRVRRPMVLTILDRE